MSTQKEQNNLGLSYMVYFKIPYRIEDEDGLILSGDHHTRCLVRAFSRSEAKMKALQKIRKLNRGIFWISFLNKNPFKYMKVKNVIDKS